MKDAQQAVVVEGYTDVMACHLAGVKTAVASCGTAFGTDHARVLRRFLGDHGATSGEVIFTFDGDSAGQKAAMKVLESDQVFASQTYVAVAPEGMDPCDLRIKEGDEAVRELVAKRQPLYRFALDNILARHDLDRADGRVDALRDAAGLVASIRDKTKVESFSRELAHMVGLDLDEVRSEVRRAANRPAPTTDERRPSRTEAPEVVEPARPVLPSLSDPRFLIERELLKLLIQHPAGVGRTTAHVTTTDFTHPTFQGVWEAVTAAGGPVSGVDDPGWANRVRGAATDPAVIAAITELGVEPVRGTSDPNPTFAVAYVYRLQELTTSRRIADVKARLQRTNPVEHALDYNRMFGELVMLEQHRRKLRERAVGPGATA
jgi:DNA primase